MKIEKKTWPEYFEMMKNGQKTFDVRLADFNCNAGDVLLFKEWDPEKKDYTGRTIEKEVTYVFRTKESKTYSQEQIDKYGLQIMTLK